MKINDTLLSIPPYISTTWQNISGISSKGQNDLEIHLVSGGVVTIPQLDKQVIDLIFFYHAGSLENKEVPKTQKANVSSSSEKDLFGFPFNMPFSLPTENVLQFGQILQHNPEQSDMPEIPNEILGKVSHFAKAMTQETGQVLFPDTQPHCNCLYCQVGRAVNLNQEAQPIKLEEEIVSDEDLKFKEWDISKTAESLYEVKNPLDNHEVYQVFLGHPIGCTCGRNDCEHIKSVLNTEL